MAAATATGSLKEFARFGRVDAPCRIEALHARFDNHTFSTHAHDTWSIGAVITGAKDISTKRGSQDVLSASQIYALPPHRAHAGKTVSDMCEYVMLYVPDEVLREQCDAYGVDVQWLMEDIATDQERVTLVKSFVDLILLKPESIDAWSGEWTMFCESLLSKYRGSQLTANAASETLRAEKNLKRAYDYLREFWNCNVSLSDLARETSMSAPEVCRRFSAAYGLSPHRYQVVSRVMRVKSRLLDGVSIPEAANDAGFADQSHLGRHFKSILGVTPGEVANAKCKQA